MKNRNRSKASGVMPSRQSLISQAMKYWKVHAESWVSNIPVYEELLEKKRELGMVPLGIIKKSTLDEYPKIEFMEIRTEEKAREYLRTINSEDLLHLVKGIEKGLNSHAYVTVKNRILDFRAQLKRREYGINIYAIDPDVSMPRHGLRPGKHATANPEE